MSVENSQDELDVETFGPLVSIPASSLILLASKIQKKALDSQASTSSLVARVSGSYNIAHIIQLDNIKLVIRVPATGWGSGMTETAADAIRSHVTTLRLIKSQTTIPVPEIYGFDTTCDNEIGAPYICMSFMPGAPVSQAWFDPLNPSLEARRLRILTSLSQALAQLAKFSFKKIGSLQAEEDGRLVVGPCYSWHENDDGSFSVVASGPYDTMSTYLRENSAVRKRDNEWGVAEYKLLDVIVPCLPVGSRDESFVLSAPDLDSQNVLVDEEGNVTGIIDWDHVQTMPRCVGYSGYPSWITRDWDPLMYGWPRMKDSENSPEELDRYREHFDREMGAALGWEGDWIYTKKSHIREAVWIAALHSLNRPEICRKLVEVAIGGQGEEVDALGMMYDLGSDYLDEQEWRDLKQKLEALVS
ncbi:hypothetical protein GGS23DRAFT_560127 [Durotheca rogersii]|uniref:uncharacterized protein n=1 Tax=Durotheca rogersii TaxID=419775 RepID=UPI0022205795|nr:uncharacterized protein GGS23DRAFT_560127 [Durotheca rogersii]KAI5865644.1 hypothetical protein GGS23DRAFT_560127 [Durotheca rogersii]